MSSVPRVRGGGVGHVRQAAPGFYSDNIRQAARMGNTMMRLGLSSDQSLVERFRQLRQDAVAPIFRQVVGADAYAQLDNPMTYRNSAEDPRASTYLRMTDPALFQGSEAQRKIELLREASLRPTSSLADLRKHALEAASQLSYQRLLLPSNETRFPHPWTLEAQARLQSEVVADRNVFNMRMLQEHRARKEREREEVDDYELHGMGPR